MRCKCYSGLSDSTAKLGFLLFLISMVACSEVIDLDSEVSAAILVVDGRLTDGSLGNEIRLATTSTINANQSAVGNATITLIEDGNPIASYEEFEAGAYRLVYPNDSARVGRTYELLIELRDGSQYRTVPAVMPGTAVHDNLRFEVGEVRVPVDDEGRQQLKRLASLYANSEVIAPGENFFLRWDIFETYQLLERLRPVGPFDPVPVPCYVTNDITGGDVRLFDGEELRVENIPEELIATSEIDTRFATAYFFNVVSSNMNRSAFEYYSRVDELANLQGQIFDPPPAPIPGNIISVDDPEEQVLGFFLVANADTSRVKISIDDVPFNVALPCPDFNRFREPPYCTNCVLFENSTREVPFFWY